MNQGGVCPLVLSVKWEEGPTFDLYIYKPVFCKMWGQCKEWKSSKASNRFTSLCEGFF